MVHGQCTIRGPADVEFDAAGTEPAGGDKSRKGIFRDVPGSTSMPEDGNHVWPRGMGVTPLCLQQRAVCGSPYRNAKATQWSVGRRPFVKRFTKRMNRLIALGGHTSGADLE